VDPRDLSATSSAGSPGVPTPQATSPYARRLLVLLVAANLLNFFDRVMPGILVERIRVEFRLGDVQIGLLASALTLVYATAGVPLGRLADRGPRNIVVGAGLAAWSLFTAATAAASSFAVLLMTRVGVGIGEASCAPAANSLIGDLYPADRRSRAVAVFMLGLPLGLMLAYFTVGPIADAFDSWRAPFLLAVLPGLVVALLLLRTPQPVRGAAEGVAVVHDPVTRPVRRLARLPTFWWLLLAFVAYNVAAQTVGVFFVPLLQRHFGLSLGAASVVTGFVVGVTGLVGLVVFGGVADRATRRSARLRVALGAGCLGLAAPLTLLALVLDDAPVGVFAVVFGLGWLLTYGLSPCFYAAVSDVVEPRLRATAVAVLFALGYLLGGALGPLVVGAVSDARARQAMTQAGKHVLTTEFKGVGLHDAMLFTVPASLVIAAAAMVLASRSVARDRRRMLARLSARPAVS
jgi:MFS family permease